MGKSEYESYTVGELQDKLTDRGLSTEGRKAELVDRLVEADREAAEGQTVEELKDKLRDRDQPVSGTKDELVERLVEGDEDEEKDASALQGYREQREVLAGGHVIKVDVDPPTPDPIDTCSICGAEVGTCIHTDEDHTGVAWAIAEPVEAPPARTDETFWPDETVGPRSAVGDQPDADVEAAREIADAREDED
jgi:hypothetical protein